MVKITQDKAGPNAVIKIEGKLLSPWLEEVRRVCDAALAEHPDVMLDLTSVHFVDGAGVELIHELRRSGVVLASCSSYLAELLKTESL